MNESRPAGVWVFALAPTREEKWVNDPGPPLVGQSRNLTWWGFIWNHSANATTTLVFPTPPLPMQRTALTHSVLPIIEFTFITSHLWALAPTFGLSDSYGPSNNMSRFTRTLNLYPTGTLIVGWMFRFLRAISAPVWLTDCPTEPAAICAALGYWRTLPDLLCGSWNPPLNTL